MLKILPNKSETVVNVALGLSSSEILTLIMSKKNWHVISWTLIGEEAIRCY
jgi:hypothetical protein